MFIMVVHIATHHADWPVGYFILIEMGITFWMQWWGGREGIHVEGGDVSIHEQLCQLAQ